MITQEFASLWTQRWPRDSELSNRQYAYTIKLWAENFPNRDIASITREEAREYGLKHPSRIPCLRAAFNDALRDDLVQENPFAALRITKPRRERYFPTEEEVQNLIRAAEEPLRGRIRFSAYTGLRLGEMLAVRPVDFSVDWCRIKVRWQIDPEGKRVGVKGKLDEHWACVPAPALVALAPLGLDHASEERRWPLTRYEHNKEWNALRKRLELPENFVWHSLRHHAATWFLDRGASFEDVAIQLGHSDNGVQVRETYGHMNREKALDRLEAVVS